MFGRKQPNLHIPGRVRAYGRARIEIAQRAQTREEWDALWKPPQQYFPFEWGEPWKQCIEYKVDDFAAEVGFFIDILGLPVNAFNADYAMFTSPGHDFYFAVVPAQDGTHSTPADAFRLQFMVADIFATTQELARRGVHLEQEARPIFEGSQQWVASFRTPHGIALEIWGLVEMVSAEPDFQKPEEHLSAAEAIQSVITETALIHSPATTDASLIEEETELEEAKTEESDLEEAEVVESDLEEAETAALHWQVTEDEDESYDEAEDETAEQDSLEEAPAVKSPAVKAPAIKPVVQTFQNGQAMLDHLKQKQSQRQFSSASRPEERLTASRHPAPPTPSNPPSFHPAPKTTEEEAEDSIWSQVDQDAEYIDAEDSSPDEYHYKPIPLNRKP